LTARPPWAREPEYSVFVNCPFDDGYRDLLDAIVFTSVHAGFFPWMAGSTGTVAVPRIARILEGLKWCRYSIHDLSRYAGEGPDNLSRFNMPLELGMAMALRGHDSRVTAHDWMVMVPEGHIFQQYISDLAGFDPAAHDGSRERVALAVLSWLMTRPTVEVPLGPDDVLPKLSEYSERRSRLDDRWNGNPPWGRVIDLAVEIARG
jgi:hypothetical protein